MKKIAILAAVMISLTLCFGLMFTGCGSQDAEEDTGDTQEQATEEQDESLWGDPSFGIDAGADEALQDYRTIILYGLDRKQRSDVMLFICINKNDNTGKVFTVFRDTYMQLTETGTHKMRGVDYEFFKCNHAYYYGGKYDSMKELNRHLDMNARECFGMDWDAIEHLVDNLGGIEVDVSEGVREWMNGYYGLEGSDELSSAGLQTLNGKQAVAYLRCRKDPGSDARTRSARNQAVFINLFEKAKTMSKTEKMDLFESVIDECDTNMSNQTLTETLNQISSIELTTYDGWPYDFDLMSESSNGFYFYVPDTLESNVKELHEKVFGQEGYEPSETVKELSQKIIEQKEHLH